MQYYKDQLIIICKHYIEMKKRLLVELNGYPTGRLSCWDNDGKYYYKHTYIENDKKIKRGITGQDDLIKQLARKEYVAKTIVQLDRTIGLLRDTIEKYHVLSQEEILASMSKAYRTLPQEYFALPAKKSIDGINPLAIINDSDYMPQVRAKLWAEQPYTKSDFKPEELIHVTTLGEMMRSKSEVLIAEQYYSLGIDFRYEEVIRVGRYEFAPDFGFLGKNGKPFFHEHAGMMCEAKYRARHEWKMARYQEAGIVPWKNLIITYDYDDHINMQEIRAIIEGMIEPRLMHFGVHN